MGVVSKIRGAFQVGRLVFGSTATGQASLYTVAGTPIDGTSGTLAGLAQPGAFLVDTTNKVIYQNINTQASPKWAGSVGHVRSFRAFYSFAVDGGAVAAIIPAQTAVLPAGAVISRVHVDVRTAVTSAGSATVAIGTSAGSSASSLLAATAKATLSLAALLTGVPVAQDPATWVRLSAAGSISFTVATAALTAGRIEVTGEYIVATT